MKNKIINLVNEGHGSVMLHLTKEGVENMEIVIPPLSVIEKFHNTILPYINEQCVVQKQLKVLNHIRLTLLSNPQKTIMNKRLNELL